MKKGIANMNFMSKEELQQITQKLLRDTKLQKHFTAKTLCLLGSLWHKQADFQKAIDYYIRAESLIIEEYGNKDHYKLVNMSTLFADTFEAKHLRKQAI